MNGDERFIPADEVASTMGTGLNPAPDALMQALAQIQQAQRQPMLPTDPISQVAQGLGGWLGGYQGTPNPVLTQAMQMRKEQMGMAQQNFSNQMGMANMGLRAKNEQRLEQQHRIDKTLTIAKDFLASDDENTRLLGGTYYAKGLEGLGIKVDPSAIKDIGQKRITPEEVNAIGRDLLGGMPVETAAAIYKRNPATIQMIAQIPDTPEWRSAIHMKTQSELDKDAIQVQSASIENLKKQFDWLNPEATKAVLAEAKIAFPTKRYQDLSDTDKAEMVRRAEYKQLERQNKHFDYTQQALLDKPLPLNQKALIVDPRTYQTPSGPLTQRSIEANGLVQIPDAATRRSLPAIKTLGDTVQRVMAIHDKHPEYWPPAKLGPTGQPEFAANAVAIRIGQAKMHAMQGVDPDLAAIRSSMADIVKLATTAGASSRFSNYVAQLEKDAAGWDQPGTRESKFMQLQTSLNRLNDALTTLGLEPLPTVITMPDGRRVIKRGGQ